MEDTNRTEIIAFRTRSAERDTLERAAARTGRSLSALCRTAAKLEALAALARPENTEEER